MTEKTQKTDKTQRTQETRVTAPHSAGRHHAEGARPRALVITAPGINCDLELLRAFELAGAAPEAHLLRELMRRPALVDEFELIGLPGGFSFGDDVAAGRIMAQLIRRSIFPALMAAIERRVPIVCPCNGFQIAVQAGLLPGAAPAVHAAVEPPLPVVALAANEDARFHDRWTRVEVPSNTRCLWTRGVTFDADTGLLPSAHGEGRFVAPDDVVARLDRDGQVALRYAEGENFNGSLARIAGICDPSGLVFGVMPHPERYTRWTQHPWWTRLDPERRRGDTPGLAIFRNAVDWVRQGRPARGGAESAIGARTTAPHGQAPASRGASGANGGAVSASAPSSRTNDRGVAPCP